MTQISNDKLMETLLEIKGDVSELKGQVRGFVEEVRADRVRTTMDARTQDDRVFALERRTGSLENSTGGRKRLTKG
jgi:hypothetical protein